jgi:hypothetical protein
VAIDMDEQNAELVQKTVLEIAEKYLGVGIDVPKKDPIILPGEFTALALHLTRISTVITTSQVLFLFLGRGKLFSSILFRFKYSKNLFDFVQNSFRNFFIFSSLISVRWINIFLIIY